jgi:tetratricopeptide (TPR) repeat protein
MPSNHFLLHHLAERMLEQQQHVLSVDDLFDDKIISDYVKSIQIDSPYQQMLLEGVLTESVREEKLYVSFTVEGYFHYVLGEVIYHQTEGLGAEALKQIVETNKLNGAKEGVEQCLIRDVEKEDFSRLFRLIDFGNVVLDICTVPLASAFLVGQECLKIKNKKINNLKLQVERVLAQLFINPSDNDIYVLKKTIDYLQSIQQISLVEYIYCEFNKAIIPRNFVAIIMVIQSIQHIDYDKRNEQLTYISKRKFLESNDVSLAVFYHRIAEQFENLSEFKKSLEFYKKSLILKRTIYGFQHIDTAELLKGIGRVYGRLEDRNKALNYYGKSLNIYTKLLGEETVYSAELYNNIAIQKSWHKNDFKKALNYYKKAHVIYLKIFGAYSYQTATCLNNIGLLYDNFCEDEKALGFYKKSLKVRLKIFGENSRSVANSYYNMGSISLKKEDYDSALENNQNVLNIFIKISGPESADVADSFNNIAYLWKIKADYDKALEYYNKSLLVHKKFGNENQSLVILYNNIGEVYQAKKNYKKALLYYNKSLSINHKINGDDSPEQAVSYYRMGIIFQDDLYLDRAKENFEKARIIFLNVLGEDHPNTKLLARKIKELNDQ